jgi:hypothetical protein
VVRVKPYVHSWHTGHQPRLWTKKSCTLTFRARVPLAGYAASSMLCQACCRRSRECPCSAVGSAYRLLTTISDYFGEIYFLASPSGGPPRSVWQRAGLGGGGQAAQRPSTWRHGSTLARRAARPRQGRRPAVRAGRPRKDGSRLEALTEGGGAPRRVLRAVRPRERLSAGT